MKVAKRPSPKATEAELDHGITLFLDQIIKTLKAEESVQSTESRRMSGPSGGEDALFSEIGAAAKEHGRELLQHGFTIDQVVHDYGDLCQSVTELAIELNSRISNDEFRTLNRCLDNAIAVAATEFNAQRDNMFADKDAQANVRLGFSAIYPGIPCRHRRVRPGRRLFKRRADRYINITVRSSAAERKFPRRSFARGMGARLAT